MNTTINTKNSTLICTIAGLLLSGACFLGYSKSSGGLKNFSLNLGLLTVGMSVGSIAASNLMNNRVADESEKLVDKFTKEINDLDKSSKDLAERLVSQTKTLSQKNSELSELTQAKQTSELQAKLSRDAFNKLQVETERKILDIKQEVEAKVWELDAKLKTDSRHVEEFYQQAIEEVSTDLTYKVEEAFNSLSNSVSVKLEKVEYESVRPQLKEYFQKLGVNLSRCRKLILELNQIEFAISNITDIYFEVTGIISSCKVQYRNLLNTVERLSLAELDEELKHYQNPKNFVPREKVIAALDNSDNYLETQRSKFEQLFQGYSSEFSGLKQQVTELIDHIEEKNLEIDSLKGELNQHLKPLKWTLAQSQELKIGNLIIDFFWQEGHGIYLDRSFYESDGYECKLYFQIDRNPRQVIEKELNEASEQLQQYCRTIKPIEFSYSGTKGLMSAKVILKEKSKAEATDSDIVRICQPKSKFISYVRGYERWRITGGSQQGKSPTTQIIIDAITADHKARNTLPVVPRLFNPQYGSKKDNWQIPTEGKNENECIAGFVAIREELKARQEKRKPITTFDLFIFDEVDSLYANTKSKEIMNSLNYGNKQASHQDVGLLILGQACDANTFGKMTWSDWESVAMLHLGGNAKKYIESRWKYEADIKEQYLKQYRTISEYFQKKNNDAGLEITDPGFYRFAFIHIPNKNPFFIEVPPFIFEPPAKTDDDIIDDNPTPSFKPSASAVAVASLPTCPSCGTVSTRRKDKKGRYYCDNTSCSQKSFTQKI